MPLDSTGRIIINLKPEGDFTELSDHMWALLHNNLALAPHNQLAWAGTILVCAISAAEALHDAQRDVFLRIADGLLETFRNGHVREMARVELEIGEPQGNA